MIERPPNGNFRAAAPDFAIVHLSDLHLGRSFADTGYLGGEAVKNIKNVATKGGLVMRAHDPYIVATLRSAIREAAATIGWSSPFDAAIVTGDISTSADDDDRFQFARDYLVGSSHWESRDIGLRLGTQRLLCVPGNHDKLYEASTARYLSAFSDLPSPPPYLAKIGTQHGDRLEVIGIDSNDYSEGNVALGSITPQAMSWLADLRAESTTTPHAEEENLPSRPLRILALHHHPCDLNRFRKLSARLVHRSRLTRLQEAERLLDICAGWIDVILHGHEHFPISFRDNDSGCIVISAGTTSSRSSHAGQNSFFTISGEGVGLRIHKFEWGRGRFVCRSEPMEFRIDREIVNRGRTPEPLRTTLDITGI